MNYVATSVRGLPAMLLVLSLLFVSAHGKGVPAGTFILSTNAWATYSNTAATPIGYTTNSTNTGISNLVLSVYGFSNYSVHYDTNTNTVIAGNTYYYPLWVSNHGNTNALVTVSAGSNYGGVSGAAWVMAYVDTNSNNLAFNPTNLAADAEFRYQVKVAVAVDADDGSTMRIIVTNAITSPAAGARTFAYDSPSNGMWYGGTNFETNVINLRVGGPRLVLNKSYSVTNLALANNQVVPGSIITFVISYTNVGSGAANNVRIDDRIDNAYVNYGVNSAIGGTVDFDLNQSGAWGASGNTATQGQVNTGVTGLRFALGTIAAAGSGTVTYKVVVK